MALLLTQSDVDAYHNTTFTGNLTDVPRFRYRYPGLSGGLDPRKEKHRKLRDMLWERASTGRLSVANRHDDWRAIDRVLRGYIRTSDYEKFNKERGNDGRATQRGTVLPQLIMPVTYANLETMMTYMVAAFFRDPMLEFKGVGPEDMGKGLLMQHVVKQHVHRNRVELKVYYTIQDSIKYGVGFGAPVWAKEYGMIPSVRERGFSFGNLFARTGGDVQFEHGLLYEGNDLVNIDPYTLILDPNGQADDPQTYEYFGWIQQTNILSLLAEEADDDNVFNVNYLKHIDGRSILAYLERFNHDSWGTRRTNTNNPVDVLWMYVRLVPRDWGLSGETRPEWWLFKLAGDEIIIEAHKNNLAHGKLPIVSCAPDSDGHSAMPTGKLSNTYDQQVVIDFLYASHIQNIRKSLNDMFVVDPTAVNLHDLMTPGPGKIIRAKRKNWGQGRLDDLIKQLEVRDVTAQHIGDAIHMADTTKAALGTTDSVQGLISNKGPRISAEAAGNANANSLSRLEKNAQIVGKQFMQPMGEFFAYHTMQLMSEDTFIEVVGELQKKLAKSFPGLPEPTNERLRVGLADIAGRFDIQAFGGKVPGSADVGSMIEMYRLAAENPIVAQGVNFVRFFEQIAYHIGMTNVSDLVQMPASPQVIPDQEAEQQAQQGNLIPVGGDGSSL